jgi:hypothetical protein
LGLLCHACGSPTPICCRRNLLRVLRRGSVGTRVTGGSGVSDNAADILEGVEKGLKGEGE